jgi:hypothetical protein
MLTAFGYQVVFEKPVSDIFPGLFYAVEAGVQERLLEFRRELNNNAENCEPPSQFNDIESKYDSKDKDSI